MSGRTPGARGPTAPPHAVQPGCHSGAETCNDTRSHCSDLQDESTIAIDRPPPRTDADRTEPGAHGLRTRVSPHRRDRAARGAVSCRDGRARYRAEPRVPSGRYIPTRSNSGKFAPTHLDKIAGPSSWRDPRVCERRRVAAPRHRAKCPALNVRLQFLALEAECWPGIMMDAVRPRAGVRRSDDTEALFRADSTIAQRRPHTHAAALAESSQPPDGSWAYSPPARVTRSDAVRRRDAAL